MKKLTFILALFLVIGCDKFLDIEPQDTLTTNSFFQTKDDALAAVNAAYASFQSLNYYGLNLPLISNMSGADAVKGGFGAGDRSSYLQFGTYDVTDGNLRANEFYRAAFGGVNRSNQVLDNVPAMEVSGTFTQADKDAVLGQARFLRALNYHNLVLTFGGMPIYTSVPLASSDPLPRATAEETWAFIINDLTEAANLLPDSYDQANVGRATKGAANAMLARISAFQGDWQAVNRYADAVINSPAGYALTDDYGINFGLSGNNTSESIFEIQYTAGTTSLSVWSGPGGAGDWNSNQLSQYAAPQDQPAGQAGWAFMQPTEDLVSDYETGDLRLPATVYSPGDPIGDEIWNPTGGHLANAGLYGLKKYTTPNLGDGGQGEAINYKIIRLGEVLLLKAEAENEIGGPTNALAPLNSIRTRAGLAEINADNNPNLSQATLRDIIAHERRIELAMEGIRFFDLTQRGTALEVLGPRGFSAGDEIFPIPAGEIALTGWTQN